MNNLYDNFAIWTALVIIVLLLGGVLGLYALVTLRVPSSSQQLAQQQSTQQQPTQRRWCKDTPRFDGFVAVETCTFQGSWRTPAQLWFNPEGLTVQRTSLWGTITERWVPYREVRGVTVEHRGAHDVLTIAIGPSMGESFYFPQGSMGTAVRDAVIHQLGRRGKFWDREQE